MLPADPDNPGHIWSLWLVELLGATGEEFFKTRGIGDDPLSTGSGSDVAKGVWCSTRQVDCTTRLYLSPFAPAQETDPPLYNEKQLIFLCVHVGRRSTSRRRFIQDQSQFPAGLVTTEEDSHQVSKGPKFAAFTGLHNDGWGVAAHNRRFTCRFVYNINIKSPPGPCHLRLVDRRRW